KGPGGSGLAGRAENIDPCRLLVSHGKESEYDTQRQRHEPSDDCHAPCTPPASVSGFAPTGESSPGPYNRTRRRELAGRYTANLMVVGTRSVWSSPAEPAQLQPFRFRGGTRGVLLIHGFAG